MEETAVSFGRIPGPYLMRRALQTWKKTDRAVYFVFVGVFLLRPRCFSVITRPFLFCFMAGWPGDSLLGFDSRIIGSEWAFYFIYFYRVFTGFCVCACQFVCAGDTSCVYGRLTCWRSAPKLSETVNDRVGQPAQKRKGKNNGTFVSLLFVIASSRLPRFLSLSARSRMGFPPVEPNFAEFWISSMLTGFYWIFNWFYLISMGLYGLDDGVLLFFICRLSFSRK